MTFKTTLTAATMAAGLAIAPAAMAQSDMEDGAQAAPNGAMLAENDAKLDAFVMAALSVSDVRNDYMAQLQSAEDEEAQQSLIQEANTAIVQTVEQAPGITLDEYVAIGEAAGADEELAARINTMITEQQDAQSAE